MKRTRPAFILFWVLAFLGPLFGSESSGTFCDDDLADQVGLLQTGRVTPVFREGLGFHTQEGLEKAKSLVQMLRQVPVSDEGRWWMNGIDTVRLELERWPPALRVGAIGFSVAGLILTCLLVSHCFRSSPDSASCAEKGKVAELLRKRKDVLARLDGLERSLLQARKADEEKKRKQKEAEDMLNSPSVSAETRAHFRKSATTEASKAEQHVTKVRNFSKKLNEKKVDKLKENVAGSMKEAMSLAQMMMIDSATSLQVSVKNTLSGDVPQEEMSAYSTEVSDTAESLLSLPFPLVLAGMLAPLQLQFLYSWSSVALSCQALLFLGLAIATAIDHGKTCGEGRLWVWTYGMLSILGSAALLRWRQRRLVGAAMQDLDKQHDASDELTSELADDLVGTHGAIGKLWNLLTTSSKDYFGALIALDDVVRSRSFHLLQVLGVLSLAWGGIGVYQVIWHVVVQSEHCDALTMRFVVRVYAFFYVALFLWMVVGIFLLLAGVLAASESTLLSTFLLRKTFAFDEVYSPAGLPVLTIVVRAIFMRNDRDKAALQASLVRQELAELRASAESLKEREETVDLNLETFERRYDIACDRYANQGSMSNIRTTFSQDLGKAVDKAAVAGMAVEQQVKIYGPKIAEELGRRHEQAAADAHAFATEAHKHAASRANEALVHAKATTRMLGEALDEQGVETDPRVLAEMVAAEALVRAQSAGINLDDLMRQATEAKKLAEEAVKARKNVWASGNRG